MSQEGISTWAAPGMGKVARDCGERGKKNWGRKAREVWEGGEAVKGGKEGRVKKDAKRRDK